jgi:hypothetical protein
LCREIPDGDGDLSVPEIPDDDAEFDAFDRWTAGLLRRAAEVYAAAAQMTAEDLLSKCISAAYRKSAEADDEERDIVVRARRWNLLLERENRSRMLLEPEVLDKVTRNESGLERREVGWTKAAELAKVARRDGQKFDYATWLHKAQELPEGEFRREVEKHLTGNETEPREMLYFKVRSAAAGDSIDAHRDLRGNGLPLLCSGAIHQAHSPWSWTIDLQSLLSKLAGNRVSRTA